MKDLPLTLTIIISFLVGSALLINSITDEIIERDYSPKRTMPPCRYDPDRPLGKRFYSPMEDFYPERVLPRS